MKYLIIATIFLTMIVVSCRKQIPPNPPTVDQIKKDHISQHKSLFLYNFTKS